MLKLSIDETNSFTPLKLYHLEYEKNAGIEADSPALMKFVIQGDQIIAVDSKNLGFIIYRNLIGLSK